MTEEWRPVVGWEGLYEVSSLGRVRSCERVVSYTQPARILKNISGNRGDYPVVEFCDSKRTPRRERTFVHQVVCKSFHGEQPSPLHEVAHWDGNAKNAAAENVRWATPVENASDKERHGTQPRGETHGMSKLTADKVTAIRAVTPVNQTEHALTKELAIQHGVTPSMISLIRRRKNWRHI